MNTLNAAAIKEIGRIRPDVASHIKGLQDRHHVRKVGFSLRPAGFRENFGEGYRYKFFAPEGKVLATNMVTESTLGAMNTGINYCVGQDTPPMPEGTWIVADYLFLGKWYISVTYVGQIALAG